MDSRAKALVPRDSNPTENAYIRGAKGDVSKGDTSKSTIRCGPAADLIRIDLH